MFKRQLRLRTVHPEATEAERAAAAQDFEHCPECCLDDAFSLKLRRWLGPERTVRTPVVASLLTAWAEQGKVTSAHVERQHAQNLVFDSRRVSSRFALHVHSHTFQAPRELCCEVLQWSTFRRMFRCSCFESHVSTILSRYALRTAAQAQNRIAMHPAKSGKRITAEAGVYQAFLQQVMKSHVKRGRGNFTHINKDTAYAQTLGPDLNVPASFTKSARKPLHLCRGLLDGLD